MPIRNPSDLALTLASGARLLALDLGEKTIGLALSDPTRTVATALETLRRTAFTKDAEKLKALIAKHGIGGVVIGLPVNMNGTEGPRCQSVRAFAQSLERLIAEPIALWDERLSTMAVTRTLVEADMSRRRRAEVVDKLAAAYILQGFLDFLRRPVLEGPGDD